MKLQDVLDQWRKIVNLFTPEQEDNPFGDIYDYQERVATAVKLDDTGLSAVLIIANVLEDYIENQDLTLKQLVVDRKRVGQFVKLYTKLYDTLHNQEIESVVRNFQDGFAVLLKQAGYYSDAIGKLIEDRYAIAELRLSALKASKSLQVYQFSSGEPTSTKILFSDSISEFYDVNMLLKATQQAGYPDGVSLCLIRDTVRDEFSYFVFVVKNGRSLYLVTDKPDLPSPNYKAVGRGRAVERSFAKRIDQHFFPYELMGAEIDEKLGKYVINRHSYTTAIQVFSPFWKTIGKISQTQPDELVWMFMLFGLFQQKYFGPEMPKLPLSYSAAAINVPTNQELVRALTTTTTGLIKFEPLEFAPLTLDTLTNANPELMAAWAIKPTGQNDWMEERYKGKIAQPEKVLNLLTSPGEDLLYRNRKIVVSPSEHKLFFDDYDDNKQYAHLHGMELTEIGSPASLRNKYIWFARKNEASAIELEARREFKEKEDEIKAWYKERVIGNLDALKQAIVKGEFWTTATVHDRDGFDCHTERSNVFRLYTMKQRTEQRIWTLDGVILHGTSSRHLTCYFNNAVASYEAVFYIQDGWGISDMCGLKFEELPVFLQNVRYNERYSGNSILDAVDPLEDLENPWKTVSWSVHIFLSKSSYKAMCKEVGRE